ncbi:hypothetical protein V8J36_05370 [Frigidibacter sp. MR17.14]|uniref:hypothetical protein n=1 Tax=Frigidibacter sp. MR17.14 TaxID=3126509 RepID=UPI003012BA3A
MAEKQEEGTVAVEPMTGRAAVRALLIERLDQAGLQRPRKVTADVHEATKKRLVEGLAYMLAENLMTLAEVLIGASRDGYWPAEVLVRQMAASLQAPPARESRIFNSWLASIEGPKAAADGTLVELYRFLIHRGVPPGPIDKRGIAERSEQNNRRIQLISERVQPSAEETAWLEAHRRDEAVALEIVEGGNKKREGSAA